MNKYQSTLLAQDATPQEIQKADLDLLKKINEVDALTEANATNQAIVDASLSSQINDVNIIAHPVSDIGRLTEISGDGLSTQYLHDKSGNVIWANNGLTAVDGYRGKGLLCNGTSSFAYANGPVIGTAGQVSIIFSISSYATDPVLHGNLSDANSGYILIIHNDGTIKFSSGSDMSHVIYTAMTVSLNTKHVCHLKFLTTSSISITLDGVTETFNLNASMVAGVYNLCIARYSTGSYNFLAGTIYNFKAWSRVLSDDECISWANDPAGVDSNSPGNIITKTLTVNKTLAGASGQLIISVDRTMVFIHCAYGFTGQTLTAGQSIASGSGFPVNMTQKIRLMCGVDTYSVRTSCSLDFSIASDGTFGVEIYPNGDRPLYGGTIVDATGIFGDSTILLL